MRMYLAVAVLMLAFIACADSQADTLEERFARFGEQMTEVGRNVAEKTKTAFDEMHNSQFAVTTRDWFSQQLDKMKTKFQEIGA